MISDKLIENECKALEKSIKKKQDFVDRAPEGRLICTKKQSYYNWYISKQIKPTVDSGKKSTKNSREYVKKSNRKLAVKMALKGMYEQELLDERQELRALESFVKNRSSFDRRIKYLSRSEEIRDLLAEHLKGNWSPSVQEWLNSHRYSETQMIEPGKHRCKNGLMVRSKSEQLIVSMLEDYNIPFKYEEPLYLSNQLYFPDFTILNERTGEEYIWEHFGMMNNPDYFTHNMKKINMYFNNGYIPFVNFITTFEVDNSGIDIMWIERIIKTFFL